MSKREGRRRGRLFGRDEATGDETVAMSGNDDHAWWADRRTLAGASASTNTSGIPGSEVHDAEQRPDLEPDRWSAEALFADAGFDPSGPATAPPRDDGATTIVMTTGLDEARLVLGVTAEADWPTITKAHRALALQFHPDRLGDLSSDAQQLSRHRMTEINRAFDTLRDHHRP